MEFRLSADAANESTSLLIVKKGQHLADGSWHQLRLIYSGRDISLTVDYGKPEYLIFDDSPILNLDDDSVIVIGTGYLDYLPGILCQLGSYSERDFSRIQLKV